MVLIGSLQRDLAGTFPSLTFRPVIKKRVVWLPWHLWDHKAKEPAEYPISGEPEDYIRERPHSPSAADGIDEIWQLFAPAIPGIQLERGGVDASRWSGELVFRSSVRSHLIVSAPLKSWLEINAPAWVEFVAA